MVQGYRRRSRETDLSRGVIEKNLEVLDPEVGDSDVANLAGAN